MRSAINNTQDNVKLAVFAIVIAVLALSLGDALIKKLSVDFTLWQIFILRSAFTIPVLIVIIKIRYRAISIIPQNFGWTTLRSLSLTIMWLTYYLALKNIDLSVAAAAFYTLPIFITLFAALFIGEEVGKKGWSAIIIGFLGVLLILKPQAENFNVYALLPLFSAILYALSMILTRTKCKFENPIVLSLGLNVAFIIVGLLAVLILTIYEPDANQGIAYSFLLGSFSVMGIAEWVAICLLATAIIIGSVGAAVAYQAGPSSIVSAFDFSYLAFAAIWGLVFFGETPDIITIIGMLLITCAGLISVRR